MRCKALADASPRHLRQHRTDEPYRRALIGVYARLVASARRASRARGGCRRARSARRRRAPYAFRAAEFARRSAGVDRLARGAARRVAARASGSRAARARGRGVRLPSREHRPAPKLRHPRSGDRRAARCARASNATTRALAEEPTRAPAARRAVAAAPAAAALCRLFRSREEANSAC